MSLNHHLSNEPLASKSKLKRFIFQSSKRENLTSCMDLRYHRIKKRNILAWECLLEKKTHALKLINNLKKSLSKQSKSLQRLSFTPSSSFKDKDLSEISQGLKGLTVLKSLEINLFFLRDITSAGLSHFSKALKKCSTLKDLTLWFSHCPFLTDKSLEVLSKGLKVHVSLKKIELYFGYCEKITDSGIKNLCQGLRSLYFLQRLNLYCPSCRLITDEGLLNNSKLLKNLKNLRGVNLNFQNCNRISLDGVRSIAQDFETSYSKRLAHFFFGSNNLTQVFKSSPHTKADFSCKMGRPNSII